MQKEILLYGNTLYLAMAAATQTYKLERK